jgi:alpha-methylacyl-CoA racemase
MERLGLGPDVCRALNRRLVYGRITGWGQTGPLADQVGHDLNYLGLTGALHAMGPADRPPPPPLNLVADYGGGAMLLVSGVLAAVIGARSSGEGRVVDAAMTDGVGVLSSLFHALGARGLWSPARESNLLDGGAPFYRCYACADGGFVAVAALEPRFFAALLAGLEIDAAEVNQYDRDSWPTLQARFEGLFAARARDAWAAHFAGTEACVTPVLSFDEARRHPQATARAAFTADGAAAPAPRFDGAAAVPQPAGSLGLHAAVAAWRGR